MNILCNPTGKKDGFRGIDWLVEHNNLYIKVSMIYLDKHFIELPQIAHIRRRIFKPYSRTNPYRITLARDFQNHTAPVRKMVLS
jgi:hypothetical protein